MFAYDDAVIERYPTIRAGVVHAAGLTNRPSLPELLDEYWAEQRAASGRLKATATAELPSIAAWRRAFTKFGAKLTRHRNAAEALLQRLARHDDTPTINTLIDLVSIRYAMPVAVFDRAINGPLTVRFAAGAELFTDLEPTAGVHPDPGEVVFVHSKDAVSARRWCWRQSAGSATGTTTVDALIVVEATTIPPARTSNRQSRISPRYSPHTSPAPEPGRTRCRRPTHAPERTKSSRTLTGERRASPAPLVAARRPPHPSVGGRCGEQCGSTREKGVARALLGVSCGRL